MFAWRHLVRAVPVSEEAAFSVPVVATCMVWLFDIVGRAREQVTMVGAGVPALSQAWSFPRHEVIGVIVTPMVDITQTRTLTGNNKNLTVFCNTLGMTSVVTQRAFCWAMLWSTVPLRHCPSVPNPTPPPLSWLWPWLAGLENTSRTTDRTL